MHHPYYLRNIFIPFSPSFSFYLLFLTNVSKSNIIVWRTFITFRQGNEKWPRFHNFQSQGCRKVISADAGASYLHAWVPQISWSYGLMQVIIKAGWLFGSSRLRRRQIASVPFSLLSDKKAWHSKLGSKVRSNFTSLWALLRVLKRFGLLWYRVS